VHFLKKPRILLAYNLPTSPSSVGAVRFLLERSYGYPVTLVHTLQLGSADLSRFNVLILPDDSGRYLEYSDVIDKQGISNIKKWVEGGGTLIALGGAAEWLTDEAVGLLATQTEKRPSKEKEAKKPEKNQDAEEGENQHEESPVRTPGAILRVSLDQEHWLTAGYGTEANALVNSNRVFSPLKLDKGRNLAVYMPEERLWLSGFIWEEAKQQLAGKAFLMHQDLGRGNIIAFAEDPTYRAFVKGLELLFISAVFFGPSY
jgi:hypothetical protein